MSYKIEQALNLYLKISRLAPPHPPTDRSKAVVLVLVLLFVPLWFILRGDLLYVLPCIILFFCFSVFVALRLPLLGKGELILVLFVCLFDLCLFGFVGFPFLLVSGKVCSLRLWHSLDIPWTFLLPLFSLLAIPPPVLDTTHRNCSLKPCFDIKQHNYHRPMIVYWKNWCINAHFPTHFFYCFC